MTSMTKPDPIVLYSYWRSSAAYRVRIALNFKQLPYTIQPVHLVKAGGEHYSTTYRELNPQGLVPALTIEGQTLSQSLAILEFLEERFPSPTIFPTSPLQRAYVRSIAAHIACDLHPLNNLRVLTYLQREFHVDDVAKTRWYHHWLKATFDAIETLLVDPRGGDINRNVCCGSAPTIADFCLIPQVYNARRFKFDLTPYRQIRRIDEYCLSLPAFSNAIPEKQPDAE